MATPNGVRPISVNFDIVNADVPALLGLDVLDREQLVADTVFNRLAHRISFDVDGHRKAYVDQWFIPLTRGQSSHVYVPFDTGHRTHFTTTQLHKLHRQFFHPSATKLFNLLRKARPEDATPETRKILHEISKRCDPCQRIQPGPVRFRASFGAENVRFNERILLDIMYIGMAPVLHVVDEGTHFSAARFLASVSTYDIWDTVTNCWAFIYTGLPNRILVDQGSQLGKSEPFFSLASRSNVEVQGTGIEAYSSLGLGERYHKPLRDTFRKLALDYPKAHRETLLQLSVKAMNGTLGQEGLVPSALVFGEYPRVHTRSKTTKVRDTLSERASMANAARSEMQTVMAKMRVSRALKHAVPSAADRSYQSGDQVLVWREKIVNNRIGEWLGPFQVLGMNAAKKLVYVQDAEIGNARPFSVAQVKHYRAPLDLARSFFTDIRNGLSHFSSSDESDDSIYLTEVSNSKDPRARSPEMSKAKRDEIRGLLDRGTLKDMMVHNAATLQPQSIRLLLALATIHGFDIWTSDVRQAYLQSAEPLSRDIFITKPVPEFELKPEQCLRLLKPLYGLCDSGDLWRKTLDEHHRHDLGMSPFGSDTALYKLMTDGLLVGLSGGYDDILRAGSSHFRQIARRTNKRFEMGEDEEIPCTFSGFSLDHHPDGSLIQHQNFYLQKLEALPLEAPFTDFRYMRMGLAWLANTRPDWLFEISQLAQVTEDRFLNEKSSLVRRLNRATKFAIDYRVPLKIPKLDLHSLRVVGFSDSSFANNHDLSTQLGHICFLADNHGNSVPIHFKSYKSKRIVRSAMAGEVIAFSDLFDVASTLASELGELYGGNIPVQLLTDSKSLFDVISKLSRTSEKRTMLDIAAAREGFRDRVISDIVFVRSSHNLADGLTKAMSQAALQKVISSGLLFVQTEQWIIRDLPLKSI